MADEYRIPVDSWKWKSLDGAAVARPDYDDSFWEPLVLPSRLSTGAPGTVFWLRTRFTVPKDAPDRLWFLTDKMGVAMEVYVNGVYAGQRGQIDPVDLCTNRAYPAPASAPRAGSLASLCL